MTRGKAIELMDRLNDVGYSVTLVAGVHVGHQPERIYRVKVSELTIDKMDVKKLVEVADELDLDVGFSSYEGGSFSFGEPDRRPEILKTQRRHPR